ncbi:MAG: 16S rRNA (guanine(966)-N(2))-methyltransferase RsmD [Pseudomonadota bacterium]
MPISKTGSQGHVRIIAGKFKGRKIPVLSGCDIRPTTDRIRETLFNWLQPFIENANCLDLFAGSGALSFEALSRGAKSAYLIDSHPKMIANLRQQALLLEVENVVTLNAKLPSTAIKLPKSYFNLVFIDPPFNQGLVEICCHWLEDFGCMQNQCLIYIEVEKQLDPLPIPNHWRILKSKHTSNIGYHLCERTV